MKTRVFESEFTDGNQEFKMIVRVNELAGYEVSRVGLTEYMIFSIFRHPHKGEMIEGSAIERRFPDRTSFERKCNAMVQRIKK